jgi:hypothetical protein
MRGRRNTVSQDRTRYFDEGGAARKAVIIFFFFVSICVALWYAEYNPHSAMLVLFKGVVLPIFVRHPESDNKFI